jgi:hypothetical protein
MGILMFFWFLASLYFGINWGVSHAESTGGEVAMSVLGVAGIYLFGVGVLLVIALIRRAIDDRQNPRGPWRAR